MYFHVLWTLAYLRLNYFFDTIHPCQYNGYVCTLFTIFDFFQKMTKLMDILSNPNKRLAYDVLLRCESVLEHMVILLGAFQIAVSAKRQNVF